MNVMNYSIIQVSIFREIYGQEQKSVQLNVFPPTENAADEHLKTNSAVAGT